MQTALFLFQNKEIYYGRYGKGIIAGEAPLGGSAGQRSGEGTQDPDTAADPGGCDFGESITADNPNDIGTVGGIFMGSIQSSTMILCALGNRSASFLSRRAHLLTTPVGRWYFRWKPCALRGGCGFCGSLMDNATSLRSCCHCPRSWCAVNAHRIPSLQPTVFHQLPAQTCHWQLCLRL